MCIQRRCVLESPMQEVIPILKKVLLYDMEKNKKLGYKYELNPEYNSMCYLLKDFKDIIIASTFDDSISIVL